VDVTGPVLPAPVTVQVPVPAASVGAVVLAVRAADLPPALLAGATTLAAGWNDAIAEPLAGAGAVCTPLVTPDLVGVKAEFLPERARPVRAALRSTGLTLTPVASGHDGRAAPPGRDHVALLRSRLFPAGHRYAEPAAVPAPTDRLAGVAAPGGHPRPVQVEAGPQVTDRQGAAVHGHFERVRVRAPERDAGVPDLLSGPSGPGWYLFGWPGVSLDDRRKHALHLVCAVLGGRDGLLDRELRVRRGLSYSFTLFSREHAEGGYLAGLVSAAPDRLEEARTAVRALLAHPQQAVDDDAVERSRAALLVRHLGGSQHADEVAVRTASYLAAGQAPPTVTESAEGLRSTTVPEVRSAARQFFSTRTITEIFVLPA
jgi:hypothetical protein